jgi:hypothetical protein
MAFCTRHDVLWARSVTDSRKKSDQCANHQYGFHGGALKVAAMRWERQAKSKLVLSARITVMLTSVRAKEHRYHPSRTCMACTGPGRLHACVHDHKNIPHISLSIARALFSFRMLRALTHIA